jgi:hypothetical protein
MQQAIHPVLFIEVQCDFAVGAGLELVPLSLQLGANALEVIELTPSARSMIARRV